jgi:hypothetical protein
VEKLRLLAEACDRASRWPPEDPFVKAAYAFGDVLEGTDPLECAQVVVAINLPPAEVPWNTNPHGTEWLATELRLSKGGFEYWWRSYLDPPWNHHVRGPVRIWSAEGGVEGGALDALEARDYGALHQLTSSAVDEQTQIRDELDAALAHLREVRDVYWGRDWRREHRGYGRYPENELWEAVEGYLHILDALLDQIPSGPGDEAG